MNFVHHIDILSQTAAQIDSVSSNLPSSSSQHWMQVLNKNEQKDCILDLTVSQVTLQIADAIKSCILGGSLLTFSLSIDATKLLSELEISTAYRAIMGSTHPNQNISTMTMTLQMLKMLLEG